MIKLKELEDKYNMDTIEMVKDFFNFHRKLTKSPEEFYVSYEEAKESLDDMAKEKGIKSMFVSVIPRNISALNFYIECGFDHLNMIELRKNYDESLNKSEEVNILGYKLKKY